MCNKGKGVRLPVYQKAVEQTKHKCDISKPVRSAPFIRARTWFALHSHPLCFKCWKWACIIVHSRGKLLTKTCRLHGNSQLFNAANWGDGASEICFRSVQVKMKRWANLKFPSLQRSIDPLIQRFWQSRLSIVSRQVVLACIAQHFLTLMLIKPHSKKGHFGGIYLSFGQFCHYCQL